MDVMEKDVPIKVSVEELDICNICNERYDNNRPPRVLNCGHIFCYPCLGKQTIDNFICPQCKTPIKVTKFDTITPFTWRTRRRTFKSAKNDKYNATSVEKCSYSQSNSHRTDEPIEEFNRHSSTVTKKIKTSNRKLQFEGYCDEHENFNELRCMDCEVWICGVCVALKHKQCRTLLVEDAYVELKKKITLEIEEGLNKWEVVFERITDILSVKYRNKERLSAELSDCTDSIEEFKSLNSIENLYCDKLERLEKLVNESINYDEFLQNNGEITRAIEEETRLKCNDLLEYCTVKNLKFWCKTGSVYAVEHRGEEILYGKIEVKDDRVFISSFQTEKPEARLFPFGKLLFQMTKSMDLPSYGFLKLAPIEEEGVCFDVVIKLGYRGCSCFFDFSFTEKNFLLLCSALKKHTYKGLTLRYFKGSTQFYTVYPSNLPSVIEHYHFEDCELPVKKGEVYGMDNDDSWFEISLNDDWTEKYDDRIGKVISGIKELEEFRTDMKIMDCGLVIIKEDI